MNKYKNINVLVCGASNGIGFEIAKEFALNGACVTLFSRDEKKLLICLKHLYKTASQVHNILVGDFNYPKKIKQIIQKEIINKNFNILINNSGGPKGGKIIDAEINDFSETFNRHLICNHILTQSLLPYMIKSKYGRIINIISTSVKQPIVGLGVSNTIRAAVASWAKTLSLEIGINGITINNILPGYTNTSRLNEIIKTKSLNATLSTEKISNMLKAEVPLNRFAKPSEIAKLVCYLASKDAEYINGTNIPIDGGRLTSL